MFDMCTYIITYFFVHVYKHNLDNLHLQVKYYNIIVVTCNSSARLCSFSERSLIWWQLIKSCTQQYFTRPEMEVIVQADVTTL